MNIFLCFQVTIADLKVTFNYAHTSGGGVAFENGVNAILLHVTTQQNTGTEI